MGKCKGCQRNTVCFRLLEVCGTAEAYKNDPLSNKLFTEEQFITSSQLQFLKWQVVRALSLPRSFKTLLACQLQIHNKMQNPQLRKRWGRRLCVTAMAGWHCWQERGRKVMEAKRGERKTEITQQHHCILTTLATAIFSQMFTQS